MNICIEGFRHPTNPVSIHISGSKSLSNRWLILQKLFPDIQLHGLSDADDTRVLREALETKSGVVNIGHAGTAMRFLTAYMAFAPQVDITLTGSERMRQRPIGPLVAALRELGADIRYLDKEGYPPLGIKGREILGSQTSIDASISSQFITALMLIAPKLDIGLSIKLRNPLVSRSYLQLTSSVLEECKIPHQINDDTVQVHGVDEVQKTQVNVESDWSSAGYWYSLVALAPEETTLKLDHFYEESAQGDRALVDIYQSFGVESTFDHGVLTLKKVSRPLAARLQFDLKDQPDQAQTVFCTAIGLGVDLDLYGLKTLTVKETDRLNALKVEGSHFRESVKNIYITKNSLQLRCRHPLSEEQTVEIETYNDHRMAMAFAPLGSRCKLLIKDAGVVSKSYPRFWDDFKRAGGQIKPLNT